MEKEYPVLNELAGRYPQLQPVIKEIGEAAEAMISCYRSGGMLLVCGNGGSSSDSDHIVGEMMKGFDRKRALPEELKEKLASEGGNRGKYLAEKLQEGLPAISLSAHNGLITAVANDIDAYLIYAQQVVSYGVQGDVLFVLSTSGNSGNVIDAVLTARAKGLTIIGLTGPTGGKIGPLCNICIKVPGANTAFIQELHVPVYHAICKIVESEMFA